MSRPIAMRILIVRLGALGDIVHTIPLAAALRRHLPGAAIDWVADERHAGLLEMVRASIAASCCATAAGRPWSPGGRSAGRSGRSRTTSPWTCRGWGSRPWSPGSPGRAASSASARRFFASAGLAGSTPRPPIRAARDMSSTATWDPRRPRGGRSRVGLSHPAGGAARGRDAAGQLRRAQSQRRVVHEAVAAGALRGCSGARGPRPRPALHRSLGAGATRRAPPRGGGVGRRRRRWRRPPTSSS